MKTYCDSQEKHLCYYLKLKLLYIEFYFTVNYFFLSIRGLTQNQTDHSVLKSIAYDINGDLINAIGHSIQ